MRTEETMSEEVAGDRMPPADQKNAVVQVVRTVIRYEFNGRR